MPFDKTSNYTPKISISKRFRAVPPTIVQFDLKRKMDQKVFRRCRVDS